MPKFRKKPVVIEAEQFLWQGSWTADKTFLGFPVLHDVDGVHLSIPTLEGFHRATPGDWIITGVKGEQYPCKPDIFEMTYEAVELEMSEAEKAHHRAAISRIPPKEADGGS